MNKWLKRILAICPVFLCAYWCHSYTTIFYINNLTDRTVVFDMSSNPNKHAIIVPDGSVEIFRWADGVNIHILGHRMSLSTEDGDLLRIWSKDDNPNNIEDALDGCYASYFKNSVRQIYDEKEWIITDNGKTREYVFNILPEDLIPLSEIVDNKE